MYWSRYNIAKKETEFGAVLSLRKAQDLFPRPVAIDMMEKMKATQKGLSVTKVSDQIDKEDGEDVQEIIHFSRTPDGLFCGHSPEGMRTEPDFSHYGLVKFRKDLPWTPEVDLLVALAGLRET
jgi:hypothetical protein